MIVVSNTTPLIGLASIERFDVLRQIFGVITIPQAVYDEAVLAGREEGGAKREITNATWIKTVAVRSRLAVEVLLDEMDLGEAETIVLAGELHADWVLMDEKKGRRKLEQMRMPKIGTPHIDEIDGVLARHYGFTDEELDYIINYDIKYRLGDVLVDGEGDDTEQHDGWRRLPPGLQADF